MLILAAIQSALPRWQAGVEQMVVEAVAAVAINAQVRTLTLHAASVAASGRGGAVDVAASTAASAYGGSHHDHHPPCRRPQRRE